MSDKEKAKAKTKKMIVSALGKNAFRKTPSAARSKERDNDKLHQDRDGVKEDRS